VKEREKEREREKEELRDETGKAPRGGKGECTLPVCNRGIREGIGVLVHTRKLRLRNKGSRLRSKGG
jgi:hypothetical protein